ncbi:MAG: HD domain-containing protein [Rhodobacteraceae bacterium]|nr:HD domain-containing protein [Paracoccaceae bacterium]
MSETNMNKYTTIVKLLESYGYESYISGSTACDLYRKVSPQTIHVSVAATFIQLQEALKDKIVSLDSYTNIVKVRYKAYEYLIHPLTTIKLKNTYCHFKPTDSFEENANHLGFTIHALYYNPLKDTWLNFHNAKNDIDNQIVRFIGNPEDRILESKIRLLQGPILVGVLGDKWSLDGTAHDTIKQYYLKLVMAHSSQVKQELTTLFAEVEIPSKVFNILRSTKLVEVILPELALCYKIPQSNKQKNLTLWDHIMFALDSIKISQPNHFILRLAALLHDIGKPHCQIITKTGMHFYSHENVGAMLTERILYNWGFSKTILKKVSLLVKHHLFNAGSKISDAYLNKLIAKVGPDHIHDLIDLRIADRWGTGRKDIKMDRVEAMRTRVNQILAKTSPQTFKLSLSETEIRKAVRFATDDTENTIESVKQYLEYKVLYGKLLNKASNLKRAIREVNKLNCPLDKPHLFKTWSHLVKGEEEAFENGRLKCGVYCNFICDKKLKRFKIDE